MLDDIFSNMSDRELADTALYNSIISLLNQVKLVHGGDGLIQTLKRHQKLTRFLTTYQKRVIIDLEGNITDNLHCKVVKSDS